MSFGLLPIRIIAGIFQDSAAHSYNKDLKYDSSTQFYTNPDGLNFLRKIRKVSLCDFYYAMDALWRMSQSVRKPLRLYRYSELVFPSHWQAGLVWH
jgi:hypothetical protein